MAQATPMMRQWERIKTQYPDVLLLFRLGDFYELFGEDAQIASRELELTLTGRSDGGEKMPMCGVPYHAAERYIAQLVAKGYRCAICEQMEDPKYSRGLVKREVVRVLSPGTVLEDAFLQSVGAARGNNFLAALAADASLTRFGLALLDISTGEFMAGEVEGIAPNDGGKRKAGGKAASNNGTQASTDASSNNGGQPVELCDTVPLEATEAGAAVSADQTPLAADEASLRWARLREELLRFSPSEVLVPQSLRECAGFLDMLSALGLCTTASDATGMEKPYQKLCTQFRTSSLRGYGLEELSLAQEAAALALDYVKETQLGALGHIRRIGLLSTHEWMLLDSATRRNLELVQSLRDGSSRGTLLGLLDETKTGAGTRLLRKWILQPLLIKDRILRRQEAVSELLENLLVRRDVRDLLKSIGDIERLVSRAVTGQGNARDLVALRTALQTLPAIRMALESCAAPAITKMRDHLEPAPQVLQLLESAIADEPPAVLTEGGLIREGYDEELDETRRAAREGKTWIAQLEESERTRTGIKSLKVGFNNVFGYYIEITKSNLSMVPADYTRKQTTANAERFVTPDLKEKEALILGAQDRINEREKRLFESVRSQVAAAAGPLLETARALAHLDVYASFAEVAARRDFVRPEITDDASLAMRSGRHPVVEAALPEPFVPNDCMLDTEEQQVLIITGPNASGKSTYLRQVALISLMAQIGSFLPATSARIGLIDRIFTRVGAQDDLATGQSTFTVEMNETANILNNATPRSLVILDEVGRGTSTYDGLSIAWAVAEHLHEIGCKTLFATHYHHLNELEERLPRVKNYRIAVKEDGEHIIFLRRIIRGGTDRSFGIQVARLAGLPTPVIARSKELLEIFSRERLRGIEDGAAVPVPMTPSLAGGKPSLFDGEASAPIPHPVVEALRTLDIDNLTPLEAIVKLQEFRKQALQN
ncbi:MAG: DNA mismatch repair protein MutS [Abitibacteriaceae bacterium]|nr:DNA mismatch repair protein MutS [Abditibacteriaceae bacterium]